MASETTALEAHERECAIRYENIEKRLEAGSKRFDKLEIMLNKDEKARGLLAKAYLVDAIESSKHHVVIQTKLKDSKGKFGRVLGDVVVDGVNINKSMIHDHHAVAYFGQSKQEIEEEHEINRAKLIELGVFIPNE